MARQEYWDDQDYYDYQPVRRGVGQKRPPVSALAVLVNGLFMLAVLFVVVVGGTIVLLGFGVRVPVLADALERARGTSDPIYQFNGRTVDKATFDSLNATAAAQLAAATAGQPTNSTGDSAPHGGAGSGQPAAVLPPATSVPTDPPPPTATDVPSPPPTPVPPTATAVLPTADLQQPAAVVEIANQVDAAYSGNIMPAPTLPPRGTPLPTVKIGPVSPYDPNNPVAATTMARALINSGVDPNASTHAAATTDAIANAVDLAAGGQP